MKSKRGVTLRHGKRFSPTALNGFEGFNGVDVSAHKGVSRSLRFMAKNFTRPIQLGDVVEASGMSRRGLMKAFSQHLGDTPGSFMRQARIDLAKRLLIEHDLPLKTIALIIGFRSENTFCVAFNRAAGMPPKKFQRQAWLSAFRNAGIQQVSNFKLSPINS